MNQNKNGSVDLKEKFGIDYILCCYSEKGVAQLADIIAYRVERAQFSLLRETYDDLTWEEYLYYLSESPQMRERARCAALRAERGFAPEQFGFEQLRADEKIEKICIVRIFEEKLAQVIVLLFLLKAELEQHRRLRAIRGEGYSLAQYMRDLQADEGMIAALRTGFEDALRRLDFRAAWLEEGYDLADDLFA